MEIINKDNIKFVYNKEKARVYEVWNGTVDTKDWREAHVQLVEFSKKEKITTIISNTQELGILKKADADWASEVTTPLLIKNGLKALAFVVSANIFSNMAVKEFANITTAELQIKYFKTTEDAEKWLEIFGS